jgi:hypothetical protein
LRYFPIGSVPSSAGQDLTQTPSEYTAEADSNAQAASDWTRGHSQVTWHADRLLHVPGCCFKPIFRCCCAAVEYHDRQCGIFIIGPVAASCQPMWGLRGPTGQDHQDRGGGRWYSIQPCFCRCPRQGIRWSKGRRGGEKRGCDIDRASSHEQPAVESGKADSALTSPSTARPTIGWTGLGNVE